MKLNILYFLGLTLLFINGIIAKNDEISFDDKKEKSNGDNYYLIFVNNTYGEYRIFKNSEKEKRQEAQLFVETLLDEIDDLIINNKDTVKSIEPDRICNLHSELNEEENYYNYDDIVAETNWGNVTVDSNADFHLSILSQGRYNPDLVNEYDHNYYFPSSAGKDVDIIVIDSNFHFDYPEFSNKEREAKCIGSVHKDGTITPPSHELICGYNDEDHLDDDNNYYSENHGAKVADAAAGINHGVAKRANIYGISQPTNPMFVSYTIIALEWVKENYMKPHKTVINLSMGYEIAYDELNKTYQQYKKVIADITNKGGIVVSSAGNDKKYLDNDTQLEMPCELEDVICVGGINNNKLLFYTSDKSDRSHIYDRHRSSNYGKNVNIYAPFNVYLEYIQSTDYGHVGSNESGTSFSSPIVAGLIAQLISQNPHKTYNKNEALKELRSNSEANYFYYTDVNNDYQKAIIANNGKHSVYSPDNVYNGCGILAGHRPCENPEDALPMVNIPIQCRDIECLNTINSNDIIELY
eukprot:jgi/Orpsp1_1/1191064/evm.model.d7180000083259.1